MPERAVQCGNARHAADVDRDAGAGHLHGVVPANDAGVGDGRAHRQRLDRGLEAQQHGCARGQWAVLGEVVRGNERARDRHAGGQPVHRRGQVHVAELACNWSVEIVGDHDVVGRHRADVRHLHDVLELLAGQCGAAAQHGDLLGDRELLAVAHHYDGGLGAGRRVAVAVGQQVRHFGARDHGLVGDQRAARDARAHHQVELNRRALVRVQRARSRDRQWRRQVARADRNPGDERRDAGAGRTHRQTVERQRVGEVAGVRGNRVAQHGDRGRDGAAVVDGDRVAEHVARIDGARSSVVDLQGCALHREEKRRVADHVASGIVHDRRARIVRRQVRQATRRRVQEGLVRDHRAIESRRVDYDLEAQCGDIVCRRVGAHQARRGIAGREDQKPGAERREPTHSVGHRRAVERGAAGHVLRAHRDRVAKHGIGGIVVADVSHRDRVTERLPGEQQVRVARLVARDLLELERRGRLDHYAGGILVAHHHRVGGAVHARVVTVGEGDARNRKLRLVGRGASVGDHRRQRDLVLDDQAVVQVRQHEVAHIDEAGALRAAGGVGEDRVRSGRYGDESERAGHEECRRVQPIELVTDLEVVERNVSEVLDAQLVAERVARCGRESRVRTGRQVDDGLLEEGLGQGDRDGVGVLVVECADAAVDDAARVAAAIVEGLGGRAVATEPLGRAGDVGQYAAVLRVAVENGLVADDQPLVRSDGGGRGQHRELEAARSARCEGQREVRAEHQGRRDGGHPVGLEHLSRQLSGRRVAGAAGGRVGQQVREAQVEGRTGGGVVKVQPEDTRHAERHLGRTALLQSQSVRADDPHRSGGSGRSGQLAGRVPVDPVIEIGCGVREAQAAHVDRRVFEHDPKLELDLLARRDVDARAQILDDQVRGRAAVGRRPGTPR